MMKHNQKTGGQAKFVVLDVYFSYGNCVGLVSVIRKRARRKFMRQLSVLHNNIGKKIQRVHLNRPV